MQAVEDGIPSFCFEVKDNHLIVKNLQYHNSCYIQYMI